MDAPSNADENGNGNGLLTLRIRFKSETVEQFIGRYGADVSPGGLFVRTRDPLAVGTGLNFEFSLANGAPLLVGNGTVVWVRDAEASRPGVTPGMGVRFDRLNGHSQTVLGTILAAKTKRDTNTRPTAPVRVAEPSPPVAPEPAAEADEEPPENWDSLATVAAPGLTAEALANSIDDELGRARPPAALPPPLPPPSPPGGLPSTTSLDDLFTPAQGTPLMTPPPPVLEPAAPPSSQLSTTGTMAAFTPPRSGKRVPAVAKMVAVVLVTAGVMFAAGWFLLLPRLTMAPAPEPPPRPGRIESPAPPPAAAPIPEPEPAPAAKPAASPDPAPAGKEPPRPAPAAAAKAQPAQAAKDEYWLSVRSEPAGADVMVDGQLQGKTPFQKRIMDIKGPYAITVRKEGYEPHEQMLSGSDEWVKRAGAYVFGISAKLTKVKSAEPAAPAEAPAPAQPAAPAAENPAAAQPNP